MLADAVHHLDLLVHGTPSRSASRWLSAPISLSSLCSVRSFASSSFCSPLHCSREGSAACALFRALLRLEGAPACFVAVSSATGPFLAVPSHLQMHSSPTFSASVVRSVFIFKYCSFWPNTCQYVSFGAPPSITSTQSLSSSFCSFSTGNSRWDTSAYSLNSSVSSKSFAAALQRLRAARRSGAAPLRRFSRNLISSSSLRLRPLFARLGPRFSNFCSFLQSPSIQCSLSFWCFCRERWSAGLRATGRNCNHGSAAMKEFTSVESEVVAQTLLLVSVDADVIKGRIIIIIIMIGALVRTLPQGVVSTATGDKLALSYIKSVPASDKPSRCKRNTDTAQYMNSIVLN
mmetsp:Transcript_57020/g.184673  ORF Transcript_57020/g.184673 Transcript_57020/m.184673 type:complete len:346 (-) Transcript_57020:84-1121(-)